VIAKPMAFFRRDFAIAMTYRVQFIKSLVMMGFTLVSMSFLGTMVDGAAPVELAPYGNDYFAFAVVGTALAIFAQAVSAQFAGQVRTAQVTGTLEVLLSSRTSIPAFLAYSALYDMAFAAFQMVATLLLGALVLGAAFRVDEAPVVVLVLLLTVAAFAGIGILGAAFVVWFKQSEPITGAVVAASLVLSGVMYPTTVLPQGLEAVSKALPLTHSLAALRYSLMEDASTVSLGGELLALAGFALLLPVSMVVFQAAVRRAKAAGSLSHY
jgi:ABC-2 type transport system permease protein